MPFLLQIRSQGGILYAGMSVTFCHQSGILSTRIGGILCSGITGILCSGIGGIL